MLAVGAVNGVIPSVSVTYKIGHKRHCDHAGDLGPQRDM